MKSNDKPYILHVAEKIYLEIFRIKNNHIFTIVSNKINSQKITNDHTCYKLISAEIFNKVTLEENGFNFCPEITAKFSQIGIKIYEVPISYNGRTHQEGKKILDNSSKFCKNCIVDKNDVYIALWNYYDDAFSVFGGLSY